MTTRAGASFVVFGLLARVVAVGTAFAAVVRTTTTDFGLFAFAQSTATTLAMVMALNLTVGLNVQLSDPDADSRSGLAFCEGFTAAAALLTAIGMGLYHLAAPGVAAAYLASVYVLTVAGVGAAVLQGFLFALGEFVYFAGAALGSALLTLVVLFLLPRGVFNPALTSACVGAVVLLAALYARALVRQPRAGLFRHPRLAASFMRRYGRRLTGFGLKSLLVTGVAQLALWWMQQQLLHRSGAAEVARFAIGAQFFNLATFLPTLIAPLLLSAYARDRDRRSRRARMLWWTAVATVGSAAAAAASWLVSPWVLPYLPHLYREAFLPIAWAVAGGLLLVIKAPISILLQARLVVWPDAAGSILGAVVLFGTAGWLLNSAADASLARAVVSFLALVVVAGAIARTDMG